MTYNCKLITWFFLIILIVGSILLWKKRKDIPNEGELDMSNEIADAISDEFLKNYSVKDTDNKTNTFVPHDPEMKNQGAFKHYTKKAQLKFDKMEKPFSEQTKDNGVFTYKKQKFKATNNDNLKELNSDYYLPLEKNSKWFDVEPLQSTKKIRGTHLIHPKVWHGVNTVGGSLRNPSYDLRGNVAVPKVDVFPINASTIDPDTNTMGLCNSY